MSARRSTGGVVVDDRGKTPIYRLRFRAYGQKRCVTLGSAAGGWTQQRSEDALRHTLSDVERGIWRPPDREPAPAPKLPDDPTFHEFASQWFRSNEEAWRQNTREDCGWQLSNHLLPRFGAHRLSQITIPEVDRFRTIKVREAVLSATSINKLISRLAQILEIAVEYEMIDKNPARGRRRRLKPSRPAAVWLDRAEHIRVLLDAAGDLDREARPDRRLGQQRAATWFRCNSRQARGGADRASNPADSRDFATGQRVAQVSDFTFG
jgi:hypothetical protein